MSKRQPLTNDDLMAISVALQKVTTDATKIVRQLDVQGDIGGLDTSAMLIVIHESIQALNNLAMEIVSIQIIREDQSR